MDPITLKIVFLASILTFSKAALSGHLDADDSVLSALRAEAATTDEATKFATRLFPLLAPHILELINALSGGYVNSQERLKSLESTALVACQGVYINIMLLIARSLVQDY